MTHFIMTIRRAVLVTTLLLMTVGFAVAASETAAWTQSFARENVGDFNGALTALDALRAAPADPYLLAMRSAWLQHRLGKDDAAVATYGAAAVLKPDALEPQLGKLTGFLALKRYADAEIAACVVLKAAPGHYLAGCGLVEALIGAGRARDAIAVVTPLVAHFPADMTVIDLAIRTREAAGERAGLEELCARLAILKLAWGPQIAKR